METEESERKEEDEAKCDSEMRRKRKNVKERRGKCEGKSQAGRKKRERRGMIL